MGFFGRFKKSRRQINRENQQQGKEGEDAVRQKYEFNGYKMERTGHGHDFKATKKNGWTGEKESKYVEVKTGESQLSDLQKRRKRQLGKRYVVERLEPTPLGLVNENSVLSSNSPLNPKPKAKRSRAGMPGAILGSGSGRGTKKDSFSLWGSSAGSGSGTKGRKPSGRPSGPGRNAKKDPWFLGTSSGSGKRSKRGSKRSFW